MKNYLFLSMLFLVSGMLLGQEPFQVTLIGDNEDPGGQFFEEALKTEIRALLSNRYTVTFEQVYTSLDAASSAQIIDRVYASDTDAIIGMGLLTCDRLAKRAEHSKPTILTFILDNDLQNIPITAAGTSGIPNLTYIQSPFDIEQDLKSLYEVLPFKNLTIIDTEGLKGPEFRTYFSQKLAFCDANFYELSARQFPSADELLANLPDPTDAVYVLPLNGLFSEQETRKLFTGLAAKGLPAFSLLATPALDLGAYGAYENDGNLQRIPRRVAINLLKITDGVAAETLPVVMDHFSENLVLNMNAVNASGIYPNWEVLAKAVLLNVIEVETSDRAVTLQSAIAEGLQENLGLKIATQDVKIAEKEVDVARANYLPQIDASATALALDENTVRNSFGTRSFYSTSATATLTQLILSEPAVANIAIQNMLLESEEAVKRQNELDVILDITNAYLGILQSKALVNLRNENVKVTRKNYDISQAKEQVGYGGTSDVYRWESELALDNVDLNTSQAQLQQARFGLNSLLNRPIKETFQVGDIDLSDSILLVMDSRLFPLINNPGDLEIFADFLVDEAMRNLPELTQLQAAKAAQERSLLSQKRAFYLPTVALSGQYDYPISNSGYPETVMPIELKPTYSVGVSAQLPIFQGNSRVRKREQTEIGIFQLDNQLKNLRNNLELQVRSNLEISGASFSNLELSRQAAVAAEKNFAIAQNSYQQGLLNITSLIDAQNAYLSAQINATNAAYTFMSDFIAVERSIGYYHFLALPQEQDAFFQRYVQFVTTGGKK